MGLLAPAAGDDVVELELAVDELPQLGNELLLLGSVILVLGGAPLLQQSLLLTGDPGANEVVDGSGDSPLPPPCMKRIS